MLDLDIREKSWIGMQMNELVFIAVFFLTLGFMFTVIPIYLFRLYSLLKKLKEVDAEEWNRLGAPTLIMNNSLRNSCLVVKWLLCEEYLKLNHQKVLKEASLCRVLLIIGLVTTFLSFILCGIIASGRWEV